jgi:four helix bundle protein
MQEEKDNPALAKSYSFALQIVAATRQLQDAQREFWLSRQLLRAGTSIGALIEEGIGTQSSQDFLAKFGAAYRETRQTHYWLRLLRDSGCMDGEIAESLLESCEELLRIIGSICKIPKQRRA